MMAERVRKINMEFFVYINGKTHKLIQGSTVSEEYNETLDSGSIIITSLTQLELDPYDDVFIYSDKTGRYQNNQWVLDSTKYNFTGYPVKQSTTFYSNMPYFYKHLLIDQFNEEQLVLGENSEKTVYRYTISLFSETKGLEAIPVPNISITQPLDSKVSTVTYLERYLSMFNKNIKVADSSDLSEWYYRKKYSLATSQDCIDHDVSGLLESVYDVFGESYTPDFSLDNPNLKDLISKLLITKDRIPVVKDDLIYAMDITKRRGMFDLNKGQINYVYGSKSSDNYCTDLKRNYSDALSQINTAKYTEFLGFRNSDSALLTVSNMRVETKFPIYKINKMYMCYYKKATLYDYTPGHTVSSKEIVFLCKQDITPLVKLNSERNALSEDVRDFNNIYSYSKIEEIAKYKLATVGYDIGSNYITGWGEQYSYPSNFFWQNELKTYIENLFNYMNRNYKYGIYDMDFIIKQATNNSDGSYVITTVDNITDSMAIPEYEGYDSNVISLMDNLTPENIPLDYQNISLYFKHLFFEIEYESFYNGTIIHSKGLGKENVTINDNQSASLTLLESDGLMQKEKINRYGNKGLQINARYENIGDVQGLGSVYEKNNDNDIVIFHREFTLNSNVINCTYYGTKNYVLKNYFTTVYAKHRTYKLMSYGESISRAENRRVYFYLSKNKFYIDKELTGSVDFHNFSYGGSTSIDGKLTKIFSFLKPVRNFEYYNVFDESDKINYGCYIYYKNGYQVQAVVSDCNVFSSGNSLCLNIRMCDNVTAGTYIAQVKNNYVNKNADNYMMGSTQNFAWVTDDSTNVSGGTTGYLTQIGFYFGHHEFLPQDRVYTNFNPNNYYNRIFYLPNLYDEPAMNNRIGVNKKFYKDNKERLDMTIQLEPITDDDIYISPWLMKLSDLLGVYHKYAYNLIYDWNMKIIEKEYMLSGLTIMDYAGGGGTATRFDNILAIIIKTDEEDWDSYYYERNIIGSFDFVYHSSSDQGSTTITLTKMIGLSDNNTKITLKGNVVGVSADGTPISTMDKTFVFSETPEYSGYNPMRGLREGILRNRGLWDNEASYTVFTYFTNAYDSFPGFCHPELNFHNITNQSSGGHSVSWEEAAYPQGNMSMGDIKPVYDFKEQNLFWVYTDANYNFRPHMIYDELDNLNDFHIMSYEDGEINYLWDIAFVVNKALNIQHPVFQEKRYIFCYYRTNNGKYNFVFGFVPNINSEWTKIYISTLNQRDLRIFDKDTNLPIAEIPNNVNS